MVAVIGKNGVVDDPSTVVQDQREVAVVQLLLEQVPDDHPL
jgi:hypothetical protein